MRVPDNTTSDMSPALLVSPPTDDDPNADVPLSFNLGAAFVFAVSAVVAFLALFSFPWLMANGFTGRTSFLIVGSIEFVTAITAGIAGLKLYAARDDA